MASDEELDFLYGLIRVTKPTLCLETGTHHGDSAERIGRALVANGFGHLHSCEITPEYVEEARARVQGLPVTIAEMPGEALIRSIEEPCDFVFIDSGGAPVREEEVRLLGDHNVAPLGIVAMHDACVWCPNLYDVFVERGWPHLIFPTAVGLSIFQRPE